MRVRGFTLLELLLTLAIAAVLASLATMAYLDYLTRAKATQALVNVDNIKTVVGTENLEFAELQQDAVPGIAPAKLKSLLQDSVFRGDGGLTLWLIKAPARTFSSYPDRSTYALVARVPGVDAQGALLAFRRALSFSEGDAPWLDALSFSFPLMAVTGAVAPPGPSPADKPDCRKGSSWGLVQSRSTGSNTWSGAATIVACGTDGKPLSAVKGAAKIRLTLKVKTWNGEIIERGWDDQRDWQDGFSSFSAQNLSAGGGETILSVTFSVTGVVYYYPTNPAVKWDGTGTSVTILAPGGK